jgi:DNA-binding transcriptional MerR regulator
MYLTMQEVAERTGISAHAIRFYEKSGVLPRVARSATGRRRISSADVASLRSIADFKQAGLSLDEITCPSYLDYPLQNKRFGHGSLAHFSYLQHLIFSKTLVC